jgi:predicted HTH domain antitoxin
MKISIDDEMAKKCALTEVEVLQMIALSLYKSKNINAILAASLAGMGEFEFHQLLKKSEKVIAKNYDALVASITS